MLSHPSPNGSEHFAAIRRDYSPADVERLAGSFRVRHTLAEAGAARLWHLLNTEPFVATLGALTGNQAVQQVKAGLKAIYLSGWQVAADANTAGQMYPDQSLYPVDSVPAVVRRINNALRRADQIAHTEGDDGIYYMAPIIADAEAGFGGALNAYELMKAMIEAGAAGVHFEDQLASEKKCGHIGGKGLVPNTYIIPTTGDIDYTRASWSRASWSSLGWTDPLRASWSRASWSCLGCTDGLVASTDPTRASWSRASWSAFFGATPTTYGQISGGSTGKANG